MKMDSLNQMKHVIYRLATIDEDLVAEKGRVIKKGKLRLVVKHNGA